MTPGAEALVHDHVIASEAVGKEMRVRVVTPPGYDPAGRHPVVYLLHLWGRDERYWTDRLGLHLRLAEGVWAGALPPMVLALPQGDKSFYVNAADPPGIDWKSLPLDWEDEFFQGALELYGRYGDYLLHEAIPFVEAAYAVRRDRAGRAIGGLSMGGAGAAVHAFGEPGRFCAVGIHSPAIFPGAGQGGPPWIFGMGDAEAFARRDPAQVAARFVTPGNQPRIWLDCGWEDPMRDTVEALHGALLARSLAHDYHLWPGGHNGGYWTAHVDDYLAFYGRGWAGGAP